jgi:predicted XRE-type DNA-binding protein
MERWQDIPSFSGYQVSTLGRVRSLDRTVIDCRGRSIKRKGKGLKPYHNRDGYLVVGLRLCGVTWHKLVHVLVAEAFLGIDGDKEVHHKDRNRQNNRLENLVYKNGDEHLREHFCGSQNPAAKLDEQMVIQIQELLLNGMTQRRIARRFGVQQSTISRIKNGQRWGHLPGAQPASCRPSFDDLLLELAFEFTLEDLPELAF